MGELYNKIINKTVSNTDTLFLQFHVPNELPKFIRLIEKRVIDLLHNKNSQNFSG